MNWGKGLAISLGIFITFIVVMVVIMMRDDDSLYEKDYYEKGEAHTEVMAKKENAKGVEISYSNGQLSIRLPEVGTLTKVKLKHMGNSANDLVLNGSPEIEQKTFNLITEELAKGIWYAEVNGTIGANSFFTKEELIVP
jgi:hypothetical protein